MLTSKYLKVLRTSLNFRMMSTDDTTNKKLRGRPPSVNKDVKSGETKNSLISDKMIKEIVMKNKLEKERTQKLLYTIRGEPMKIDGRTKAAKALNNRGSLNEHGELDLQINVVNSNNGDNLSPQDVDPYFADRMFEIEHRARARENNLLIEAERMSK